MPQDRHQLLQVLWTNGAFWGFSHKPAVNGSRFMAGRLTVQGIGEQGASLARVWYEFCRDFLSQAMTFDNIGLSNVIKCIVSSVCHPSK